MLDIMQPRRLAAEPSSDRRGFLRSLAGLPFIGGSVALIGAPTAVALPVSDDLLNRYMDFLSIELREAVIQSREMAFARHDPSLCTPAHFARMREHAERTIFAADRPRMVADLNAGGRPSSRAAVILAAAGTPFPGIVA